jgi:hypothetical protein
MTDFRDEVESEFGLIYKVAGPLVVAKNMSGAEMYELVKVGPDRLVGFQGSPLCFHDTQYASLPSWGSLGSNSSNWDSYRGSDLWCLS